LATKPAKAIRAGIVSPPRPALRTGVGEGNRQVKWLDPEDLYYLGFHFAEKDGAAKHFGGKMLKLVVKRSPKTKTGQAAKTSSRGWCCSQAATI